jgi:hypothetical protein
MVVELDENRILVWATGSSTPCISLFKPYLFGNPVNAPVFYTGDLAAQDYWKVREEFHRAAIGRILPESFYNDRDALEHSWISAIQGASAKEMAGIAAQAERQETEFFGHWLKRLSGERKGSRRFLNYWAKKTLSLKDSGKPYRAD